VATPELASLPDDEILAHAAASGRSLVTANIKDLLPLAARDRLAGRSHSALILVSSKTFPQGADTRAAWPVRYRPCSKKSARLPKAR
jgi:hypothetical protein